MDHHRNRPGGRRGRRAPIDRLVALGLAAAALLAACGEPAETRAAAGTSTDAGTDPATPPAEAPSPTPNTAEDPVLGADDDAAQPGAGSDLDPGEPPAIDYPTGIVPAAIEIPAIGVRASTIELDLIGPEPEVPADFADTGWYRQTRRPGEIGPAVIAGHIDSVDGPAVFARLDELVAGDEIIVSDGAGGQRRFVVERSGRYPKNDLPDEVFGFDLPVPELRLITCGGTFDRATGHYRDNHVVYAVPA